MQMNDSLQLVVPIREDDSGVLVHGYHTPISREVFEANYRILAATKAALSSKGIGYQMGSGPRIAAMALRDEGKKDATERSESEESADSGASALLTELKRLTTIIAPGPQGWDIIPIDTALSRNIIDADEWQEALSDIVFFTCHYALARKNGRRPMAEAVASVLSASITSLPLSEYAASLKPSTKAATSGVKAA